MHLLETRIPMAKIAAGRGNTIQLVKRVMADQLLMYVDPSLKSLLGLLQPILM